MKLTIYVFLLLFVFGFNTASAQNDITKSPVTGKDTLVVDSAKQRDLIDVINNIFDKKNKPEERKKPKKVIIALAPAIGYTLSTGFIFDVSANFDFYTQADHSKNISFVNSEVFIDSKEQKNFFVQSNIWADDGKIRFVTDVRFLKYPDQTYGLGGFSTLNTVDSINYNYIRFYESVLRKVADNFFIGGGYNLDYHYNISEKGTTNFSVPDFDQYGFSTSSVSSGININLLYDSRENPVNPLGGSYANLIFRQNVTFLGSDNNWESAQLDYRKYLKLSPASNNILAIWSMAWFNFNGKSPYMDLPSTGWDTFNNLGRGYQIGRFRSRELLYLEGEYRYGITSNGLLGGVFFANAQSFSEYPSGDFKKVIPAIGTGLRVKINKHSNTNVCIDYAYGFENSKGFFVNLGEMF